MQLKIEGLSKQYRRGVWGLKGVDLTIENGVFGLLGPNGAGKTTLMSILATVTRPTEGRVTWEGTDVIRQPNALREVLGYLPQSFGVYPHLSPVEFLHYIAALKGMDHRRAGQRIEELLELVNLSDSSRLPLGGFSGGMRQRVGVVQALLNDPRLLIVDEPTAGLDPEERVRFRNLIGDLAGERIVILSTHIVTDIEAIAGDIALIQRGSMLIRAVPEVLLQAVEGKVWRWRVSSSDLDTVKAQHLVSNILRRADGVHLRLVADEPPDPGCEPAEPGMEEAYLYYMRRGQSLPAAAENAV